MSFITACMRRQITSDVMVISGDMLFNPHAFDTALIQRFFKSKGVHASKHRGRCI